MNKEMEFTATTSYALDCREGAIEPFIEEYQSKSESWHAQAQPIPNAASPHFLFSSFELENQPVLCALTESRHNQFINA